MNAMALGKTLDTLKKDGTKEDKVAVASGIAVSVVVVLLVAWAIFFFHNIQKGAQQVNLGGGAQDQFNFTSVKQAQQQLQQDQLSNNSDELLQVKQDAASGKTQTQQQVTTPPPQGSNTTDQFGTPSSSN
jgi:predicted PurR-regulated permease PerM